MLTLTLIEIAVMVLVPIVAVVVLAARRKGPDGSVGPTLVLVAVGTATFAASQILHIPLNLLAQKLGRGLSLNPSFVVVALLLGLSAGVCEEWARYVGLRMVHRRRPAWLTRSGGIAHGLGHGGVESIALGGLVALTLLGMLSIRGASPEQLMAMGVPEAQVGEVVEQARAYWATYWPLPLFGGLERVMTIVAHVAFSVLVCRAVATGESRWVWLAVVWHAALDAAAVYVTQVHGIVIAEGIVFTNAVLAFGVLRNMPAFGAEAEADADADADADAEPEAVADAEAEAEAVAVAEAE